MYDFISAQPSKLALIVDMYKHVIGDAPNSMSVRDMQQRLGPCIARANAKLEHEKIEPANVKQTYRLVRLKKAK